MAEVEPTKTKEQTESGPLAHYIERVRGSKYLQADSVNIQSGTIGPSHLSLPAPADTLWPSLPHHSFLPLHMLLKHSSDWNSLVIVA